MSSKGRTSQVRPSRCRLGRGVALRRRALGDADDRAVHVLDARRSRCRRRPSSPGRRRSSGAGTSHPRVPSRLAVHVVLRTSTSISPVCSAVNRSAVSRSTNSTLVASPSTAAAIDLAEVGVEADVLAGRVEAREAGQGVAGAAAHDVVGDHGVEHRLAGLHLLGGAGPGRRRFGACGRGVVSSGAAGHALRWRRFAGGGGRSVGGLRWRRRRHRRNRRRRQGSHQPPGVRGYGCRETSHGSLPGIDWFPLAGGDLSRGNVGGAASRSWCSRSSARLCGRDGVGGAVAAVGQDDHAEQVAVVVDERRAARPGGDRRCERVHLTGVAESRRRRR